MRFGNNSQTIVEVWADCHTVQDCEQIIEWLQLAKANMRQWEKINAKASQTPKVSASKNENTQQGEVLSAA